MRPVRLPAEPPADPDAMVRRAREGDMRAFEGLVRRHERMVFSLAARVVRERALAEEVAQEVFLQLFRALDQVESDAHVGFWLRRVATHRAIDVARREPGRGARVPLDAVPHLGLVRKDRDPWLARTLAGAVMKLPPRARAVVILRYQEDLDPTEIAALLEVPLNTVKSQLKRALALLRRHAGGLEESRA